MSSLMNARCIRTSLCCLAIARMIASFVRHAGTGAREAWVYGGNLILTLQPPLRTELTGGYSAARALGAHSAETVRF